MVSQGNLIENKDEPFKVTVIVTVIVVIIRDRVSLCTPVWLGAHRATSPAFASASALSARIKGVLHHVLQEAEAEENSSSGIPSKTLSLKTKQNKKHMSNN